MKTVKELTNEVKDDMIYEHEQKVKYEIKNILSNIASNQEIIRRCKETIETNKQQLKEVSIDKLEF